MFKPGTLGLNGAEVIAQVIENDVQNQSVDDNAVLASGIAEGTVVKWSKSLLKCVVCDGTVALGSTDTIGIVSYANGTSGQVKFSGVYVDNDLATPGTYYCQSNGMIGTTVTKVFVGTVTSAGRLVMPGGGGGSITPATPTDLGGVKIPADSGLRIAEDGALSVNHGQQMFTSSGTWTCPSGVTTVHVDGAGGGGGGGGGGSDGTSVHGGGGADAVKDKKLAVTPGTVYAITIGTGGAGGSNSGNAGTATSFGSLLTLSGGGAGMRTAGGAAGGLGGVKGTAYSGGSSMFGAGGGVDGGRGGLYGAGGAGAVGTGGAGSQGFLSIKW